MDHSHSPRPALHLHVQRLVLNDIDLAPSQVPAFREAVHAELIAQLGRVDAQCVTEAQSVRATAVTWRPGERPERLGRAVARAASRSLTERGRPAGGAHDGA